MNTDDLKAQGLTQEQIDFVMAEHGKVVNPLKSDRDSFETQLKNAKTTLKSFEGVDVTELRTQITNLTNDLQKKDEDHSSEIQDMKFNSAIKDAILKAGGKNEKAVMAILDIDSLKESKNQDHDIEDALKKAKEENDYLFQPEKEIPKFVSSTPGATGENDDLKSKANDALRSVFGKE